ncbi:FkbM family methyltransferase [Bradyrhizobium sp.]|uniref:FkbM family methyltransferase n=1 Tax=Bradyrhizobium sp. TaxID=376 RepID=UPI0039E5BE7B
MRSSSGSAGKPAELLTNDLASMNRADAERAIRAAVQTAYLGDHTALTRILGFQKFFVDTRDVGFGGHVLLDGYWEIWLTLFCLRNVKSGMVAIDVGANMGYYTVLFGSNVGAGGHVLAVEPNPGAASLLRRSIDINGYTSRTRIEEVACSDRSLTGARLVVPATEPKNAYIADDGLLPGPGSVETACVTLDALCEPYSRVDFIKIDAEGSEERIFAGMSAILDRHRPTVVMEINVARYADAAGFIRRLHNVYGKIRSVSYDGHAADVSPDTLLTSNVGQDWLVVLSPRAPL